jgi:hypothetical protein
MIDPKLLAELIAERRRERLHILEMGLVADLADRDRIGRIRLHFGASLREGDLVWLCDRDGQPEHEIRVEETGATRFGVLTGRIRPCPLDRLN